MAIAFFFLLADKCYFDQLISEDYIFPYLIIIVIPVLPGSGERTCSWCE